MAANHEGGCLCGAVRYRVKADPVRASACHCTSCQKRTGSAFGSFDDPKWFRIERFGWMRSAHPWVVAPPGVEAFEKGAMLQPKQ